MFVNCCCKLHSVNIRFLVKLKHPATDGSAVCYVNVWKIWQSYLEQSHVNDFEDASRPERVVLSAV
jgi:hypothetical protein